MSLLQFISAIPWNVKRGSGCYVGTRTLIEGLRQLGVDVALVAPKISIPVYTLTRILFNESLRWRKLSDAVTIGIDVDGYSVARKRRSALHVACIKGVLGDAVRFEQGWTRASMALQASLEARHARSADLVITVSRYCAERLRELYHVENAVVVPELIDLDGWRRLFEMKRAVPDPHKFAVLSVCRFYPRKRLEILLRAAAMLRDRIPALEIRIVGNGPEARRLRELSRELNIEPLMRWLGDLRLNELAAEYTRSDLFCLPSVQEGFGIVFLEAMAAGKAIVAARAAAVPEVVRDGILVEPENPEALAEAILRLYRDADLRQSLGLSGERNVERFAMQRVAQEFLSEIARVAPETICSSDQRLPADHRFG